MLKKRWLVLALAVMMVLGLMGGIVVADEAGVLSDEDFDGPYLAAPAVAGILLEEAGIDNRYGSGPDGGNYISDVANYMGPETDFNEVPKTEVEDYKAEIAIFLFELGAEGVWLPLHLEIEHEIEHENKGYTLPTEGLHFHNIEVLVDGKEVEFYGIPLVQQDREVLLPIRHLEKDLGLKFDPDAVEEGVKISKDGTELEIHFWEKTAYVNGNPVEMPTEAFLVWTRENGGEGHRTIASAGFLLETFGLDDKVEFVFNRYEDGDEIKLCAYAYADEEAPEVMSPFERWVINDREVKDPVAKVTMNKNKTATAHFD